MSRLQALDEELANLQNSYEEAAESFHRDKRDFERALAEQFIKADGKNQEERRSNALLALEREAGIYHTFIVSEARWEAQKAGFRVREARIGIGQSLLRAMRAEGAVG